MMESVVSNQRLSTELKAPRIHPEVRLRRHPSLRPVVYVVFAVVAMFIATDIAVAATAGTPSKASTESDEGSGLAGTAGCRQRQADELFRPSVAALLESSLPASSGTGSSGASSSAAAALGVAASAAGCG
jgi:hypothetical protein